jgi:hypothetical protein
MKTQWAATVHAAFKEMIRAHLTLVHVFHTIPRRTSVGGPCTIPFYLCLDGGEERGGRADKRSSMADFGRGRTGGGQQSCWSCWLGRRRVEEVGWRRALVEDGSMEKWSPLVIGRRLGLKDVATPQGDDGDVIHQVG